MDEIGEMRSVVGAWRGRPTVEGAGVRLMRMFGFSEAPNLDPFLLFDHFGSARPEDYVAGFPWHPHRGIETVTYILAGEVEHGDSMGNKGVIGPGDVQWMNAGSGIIHQEMPRGDAAGVNMGFQLWVNLPADHKMMPPGYQEIQADQVPTVTDSGGATVRVVCGEVAGTRGPVADVMVAPEYLDVTVPEGASFVHPVPRGHTAFAYVFEGSGTFGAGPEGDAGIQGEGTLVQYGDGEAVRVAAAGGTVRFLLVSGKPLGEPVAWHGPIVMNTKEQIREALHDLDAGTFIRHPA